MRQSTSRKRRRKKEPETQKFLAVTTIKKKSRKKLANFNKMIVARILIRMGHNWKHIFRRC